MKIIPALFLLFFYSNQIFPQYSKNDEQLVRTTFSKEFNRQIINNYLKSNNKIKVKAALLSISQSEDTSWVPQIAQLDFNIFHKGICFTLGELGYCYQSSSYLMNKLQIFSGNAEISHDILCAIGQTGNNGNYQNIATEYLKSSGNKFNGISIAIFDFFRRDIFESDLNNKIIEHELSTSNLDSKEFFEAAFALYRTGGNGYGKEKIITYIVENFNFNESLDTNKYKVSSVCYLLSYLGEIKYFPSNFDLLLKIISSPFYNIKVTAAQTLCYYDFKDKNQLSKYFHLIDDKNTTVSRQVSISVRNIKLEPRLKEVLRRLVLQNIFNNNLSSNSRGELFLSYLKLFPQSFSKMISNFKNKIRVNYLIEGCANFDSSEIALNFLSKMYLATSEKLKITSLNSLLKFQYNFSRNSRIKAIFFKSLSSNSPALVSSAADGLASNFIVSNKTLIIKTINQQCLKLKNKSDYLESLMSLYNLASKIDSSFGIKILRSLSLSLDYSIKKFAFNKLGRSTRALRKNINNFRKLWRLAFQYKKAKIMTTKGSFIIKFLPQFAPLTVGNFCYLTLKKIILNNRFHRVVPGFVIQGGDPEETGWGGPGYEINSELSALTFNTGKVGMASAGKDTEGSQWFVTTGYFPHLDGRYTIFAKVVSGIYNVQHIDQGDKVISINLF